MPTTHQVELDENNFQTKNDLHAIKPRNPRPNLWTVLQDWILALPTTTEDERARRLQIQNEFERAVKDLDDGKGIGDNGVCEDPVSPIQN